MINNKYCPNCVGELIQDNKKVEKFNNKWLVCPSCGFRSKPNDLHAIGSHYIQESERINLLTDEENDNRYSTIIFRQGYLQ